MKIQQETVFRCDFCNKHMFGKGAMSRHEKFCKKNPNNAHKCFEFCKHLQKTTEYERDDFGNLEGSCTTMLCLKRNIEMYSYKFEKNTRKPVDALNGLERMPLECDLHEYKDDYIPDLISEDCPLDDFTLENNDIVTRRAGLREISCQIIQMIKRNENDREPKYA